MKFVMQGGVRTSVTTQSGGLSQREKQVQVKRLRHAEGETGVADRGAGSGRKTMRY